MWSWMSCLSPSETSSTKDLSISSRNLLSHSRRITPFLKCASQCCKTAIDSGRHRCHRGAQNLSDLRKRQVFLKPQQQSLAIIWQASCLHPFLFFPEVIYCQIAGDRE